VSRYLYARLEEMIKAVKHSLTFKGIDAQKVKDKLEYLRKNGILDYDNTGYYITVYGRAVAESYFDVKDAIAYRNVLEKDEVDEGEVINAVMENENVLNASKGENVRVIFDNWIKGVDEKVIIKATKNMSFNDLNKLLQTINWQLYGVYRITKALMQKELAERLRLIALEARYGVPGNVLSLVQLPGIGRKRSIELMKNGIHNKTELCQNREVASNVIGRKMVEVICR
jgi:helicase